MFKVLIAGDSFMDVKIFSRIVENVFTSRGLEANIKGIEWHFKGRQFRKMMGVKRELREFVGDPRKLAELVQDIDVLLVHLAPVTKEVLTRGKRLKVIGCARGEPVNIDIEAATMLGIPVIATPGRNAEAVADYTLGLILAHTRNIARAHALLKRGIWTDEFYDYKFCGYELSGKTLGIIGLGKIGTKVARRAKAFGMKVIAYDPYVDEERMKSHGVKKVDMETLLKESDIVSIHARLTPETKHMIGEKELKLMKPTAILVNTARGSIVDEEALTRALKQGWIAGAALDVFEVEPLPPNHPLLGLNNVTLTPHIAGASKETVRRAANMLAEDAARILLGERPKYCVNPEVLPR